MNISCKYCNSPNKINNVEKYQGRKVRFRCINSACREILEVYIPKVKVAEEEEQTTVVSQTKDVLMNGLLRWQSASTDEIVMYKLTNLINVIGRLSRKSESDIQIPEDRFISRQHCFIEYVKNKGYIIYDNGSKNGVYVNDKKLRKEDKIYLTHNDQIRIGQSILIFSIQQ